VPAELLLRNFVQLFLLAFFVLILARVLLSYVDPRGRSRPASFIIQTTEPILAPIRRALPPTGMIDFSPMIVMFVLLALMRAL
jgi:YggT family protein